MPNQTIAVPGVLDEEVVDDVLLKNGLQDELEHVIGPLNAVADSWRDGADMVLENYKNEDAARVEKRTDDHVLLLVDEGAGWREWRKTFKRVGIEDRVVQTFITEVYHRQARRMGASSDALAQTYPILLPR